MTKFYSTYKKILADTITPVGAYLKLRDQFSTCILLESSDYHGTEDIYTYICMDPISEFKIEKGNLQVKQADGSIEKRVLNPEKDDVPQLINQYASSFKIDEEVDLPFITNGMFGYSAYDAVRYFEDIEIDTFEDENRSIPDIMYHVFRNIVVFNHFNNELYVIHNDLEKGNGKDRMDKILNLVQQPDIASFGFEKDGGENSNFNDEDFLEIIKKGQKHCHRGDVFQIVLSRRFEQKFKGDDFEVYRSLRSINPSPYLFYFDYGSFRLMGSSPEAQIVIKQDEAIIYPIAGTFRRSGNERKDKELADKLSADPKENAEHVMLVDLARNDLSRHCENVEVDVFKEVQYYSHVIHLVSKVKGKVNDKKKFMHIVGDTFPAGTLSGAPKHNAMKLINEYENGNRGYYGGAIGYMSFNGDFNHAIMIRSFLSKDNVLYYQAGAGVVELSVPESERQEVRNKLAALNKAIDLASELNDD